MQQQHSNLWGSPLGPDREVDAVRGPILLFDVRRWRWVLVLVLVVQVSVSVSVSATLCVDRLTIDWLAIVYL